MNQKTESLHPGQPSDKDTSNEELSASVLLEPNTFTENDKREQIIGAATVMNRTNACKIWNEILKLISIPEATEDELASAFEGKE